MAASDDTYKLYRQGLELLEDGSFGEATVPLAEVADAILDRVEALRSSLHSKRG